MIVIKNLISVALLGLGGWNGYVLYTGDAQRDVVNLATAGVPLVIGALMTLSGPLLTTILNAFKSSGSSTKVTINDISNKIDEYFTNSPAKVDNVPDKPTELRDIDKQKAIFEAINTLYNYFADTPESLAQVNAVAHSFADKCYAVPNNGKK